MKRSDGFLVKMTSVIVSVGFLFSAGIFSSCKQKEPTQNPTNSESTLPPTSEITPPDSSDTPPVVVVEKVGVEDVVNEQLGQTNYTQQFNSAISNVMGKKYGVFNIKSIEITDFDVAEEGKITFSVLVKNAKEPDVVEYKGDTTEFETFYRLANDKENYIKEILAEQGLTLDGEVEKDSEAHNNLKSAISALSTEFSTQKTKFAQEVTVDTLVEPEPPKPIEYVTVQSIADEVFKDVDFDANLKETMTTLVGTRSPSYDMKKAYAFEYNATQNGNVKFYTECTNQTTNISYIFSFEISGDMTKYSNYLNMSDDYKNWVEEKIGKTLASQIEKDSEEQTNIQTQLNTLKTSYEQEKASIDATQKSNITVTTMFSPTTLDSAKMTELGITSTNAFADALLNNTNGEGYDQVTGWTSNDVIATYVTSFGTEGVNYVSDFKTLIITQNGIYEYVLWTKRSYADDTDRYSMILSDNSNVGVDEINKKSEFSDNVILFDEEGKRIEKDNSVQATSYSTSNKTNEKTTTK